MPTHEPEPEWKRPLFSPGRPGGGVRFAPLASWPARLVAPPEIPARPGNEPRPLVEDLRLNERWSNSGCWPDGITV